jgi:hypothetical protein
MSNPNDYTRADVLTLARIIDPNAWKEVPVGGEHLEPIDWTDAAAKSVTVAGRVLAAGYRNCSL